MPSKNRFVHGLLIGASVLAYFYYNTSENNVCDNYLDYLFIRSSNRCWHEIGYYAEVPQIILQRNYTLETYYSVTEDGYILKTFRVIPKTKPKGVILLEHSFIANSEIWVDKGENSLGLYLLGGGYEIWLGNLRGSKYSNTHLKYTMSDLEYWNWSFHEQGVYDLKTQLDLIKQTTGKNDTIFIGYSMAGTSAIIYASLLPQHAKDSLKAIVNIGAMVQLTRIRGLTPYIGNVIRSTGLMDLFHAFKIGFLPYGTGLRVLKSIFCTSHPFKAFCLIAHEPFIGFSKTEFDATNAPIVLDKFPDGASTKIILHYHQIYSVGGKLRMYDHGEEINKRKYNRTEPPLYPIEKINIPVVLFSGTEDFFTHPRDMEEFFEELPPVAKKYGRYVVKDYNHFDMMFAKNRVEDIYRPIMKLLAQIIAD